MAIIISPKILIYTDGSSLGNPGPGGYAAIINYGQKKIELSGGEPHTTNNRMEMMAIIKALSWIKENHLGSHPIEVRSDSQLLVKTLTLNWKKKKNKDLWLLLDQALINLDVTFKWLKAHAGQRFNEQCDYLAKKAASKFSHKKTQFRSKSSQPTHQHILLL